MKGKLKLCCFFSHFVFHLVVSKPHFFEKLTASNGNSYDSFGYSVSIYDTYAVVGAVGSDVNISSGGVAYIFKYDNETNQWDEYSIVWPSDPSDNMQFGTSISLYQDFFIVGAWYQAPTYTGAAYVFQINKTTNANPKWVQVSKLTASDASVNDNFGKSVSITDEFAIVGSWHDNANGYQSGSAYIFEKQVNLTWVQVAKISPSDGSAYYSFGYSVAIGASNYNNGIYFVIVGAVYNDGGGCEEQENKAYIFELNTIATDESSNDWIETNIFYGNYDCFGVSVAIWDDVAVIGAYTSDTPRNSGSVTVVERANATNAWNVSTVLKTTSAIEGDYFGTSVGVYQNTIIVGATHVNTPSYDSGRAYIFYKDKDANQWYEGSTLKDDGAAGYDYLGRSVSIYEQFAMAGANGDDTSKGSVSVFDDFLDPTYSPTQLPTLPVPSPVPTIAPTKNHSLTPTMEPTFATLQPTTVPTESTPHTATLTPTLLLTPASTNVTLFTEQTRTTEIRSNTTSVINISTTESLDLSSSYIMTTVIGEESTTALFVFDDDSVGNHIDPIVITIVSVICGIVLVVVVIIMVIIVRRKNNTFANGKCCQLYLNSNNINATNVESVTGNEQLQSNIGLPATDTINQTVVAVGNAHHTNAYDCDNMKRHGSEGIQRDDFIDKHAHGNDKLHNDLENNESSVEESTSGDDMANEAMWEAEGNNENDKTVMIKTTTTSRHGASTKQRSTRAIPITSDVTNVGN